MPRNMRVYDLLISCPSDVQEYVEIIEKCVENFNRYYGEINNTLISVKHWKKDSYPESGNKPQTLLNKQFVLDVDSAVAMFWTKFGTPTDGYGSGTEEEIEELLQQGKQVFMYFLNSPVPPDKIDYEQFQKIEDFKKKYQDKGIYSIVNDREEFERELTHHLAKYFMKLITTGGQNSPQSDITIEDASVSGSFTILRKTQLINSEYFKTKVKQCRDRIDEISEIHISKSENPDIQNKELIEKSGLNSISSLLGKAKKVKISNEWVETISGISKLCDRTLPDDFFEVGNLTRSRSISYNFMGGTNFDYHGTEEEKKKNKALIKLYWEAKELQEYVEYFSDIDSLSYVTLGILNSGKTYDEDIDVTLFFEKNSIVIPEKFPRPKENIIEEINEGVLDDLLEIEKSEETIGYDNYPASIPGYFPTNIGPFTSGKSYDDYIREYENDLDRVMCFEIFPKEDVDILKFNCKYLKHHTKMRFPSRLYFSKIEAPIRYEISSKHSPDVICGEIELKL